MLVKDLMKEVYTVESDVSLSKTAQIMTTKKTGALVLFSGGKIRGIITEDDLVRNFDSNGKLSDVMTSKVITINVNEDINRALELMNRHSVKRLPVIKEDGKLIGMVNLIDIARHAEELDEDFFFD